MGTVNVTLQAAAALDRRGISATIEYDDVLVFVHYGQKKIRIKPRKFSAKRYGTHGFEWEWADSCGEPHYHPRADYEGFAAAFEKYLREAPEFEGTRLRQRMDRIGWTYEQEMKQDLEEAHERIAKDPELVERQRRIGLWPPKCGHDHPVSQPTEADSEPKRTERTRREAR